MLKSSRDYVMNNMVNDFTYVADDRLATMLIILTSRPSRLHFDDVIPAISPTFITICRYSGPTDLS